MTCHNCQIEVFKFGFHKGFQRYRCKQCGKTFSDIPASPIGDMRIAPEQAYQVVHLLCEGVGVRAIERLTQLNRRTVLAVLKLASEKCTKLMNERVTNLTVDCLEIDEAYGFVSCLQQHTDKDDLERGEQYAFFALTQNTKLIVHSHVGKRNGEAAFEFVQGIRSRINGRFQIVSDEWDCYAGYGGAVRRVFGGTVNYATEFKLFAQERNSRSRVNNPVVCKILRRTRRLGRPRMDIATTNHAERNNLSLRLFNRRFTRKTICYSKKMENHRYSVALHVGFWNFCRVHSAHGQTPAQAHGLTDHKWTIEELLSTTH